MSEFFLNHRSDNPIHLAALYPQKIYNDNNEFCWVILNAVQLSVTQPQYLTHDATEAVTKGHFDAQYNNPIAFLKENFF